MNKLNTISLALCAASVAFLAVGCGDDSGTMIDAGGHPDLGDRDLGTDAGVVADMGGMDMGGGMDAGMDAGDDGGGSTDGGVDAAYLTDGGCWGGIPVTMEQFLNHCTDRATPAPRRDVTMATAPLLHSDGTVPPLP